MAHCGGGGHICSLLAPAPCLDEGVYEGEVGQVPLVVLPPHVHLQVVLVVPAATQSSHSMCLPSPVIGEAVRP